nr:hypothetical protein [Tanacetum cinerariifolium]
MAPRKPPISDAAIKHLIAQGVADALAEANRDRGNGDDSHNSRSGERRTMPTTHEYTIVGHDAAYGMTWKILMKMMTDKYCPRGIGLMCERMFPEESDQVDKYVGGLPFMIQDKLRTKESLMTTQGTIKINHNLSRESMEDLCLCAPSATVITLGRMLQCAQTAKELATWPVTVEVQLLLTTREPLGDSEGIDNDIYSTVDACPNACEMWKALEWLKQGESINVQDLETNLY